MTSRLLSLVIWAAVSAATVYWGLHLWVKPQPIPGQAVLAQAAPPQAADLSRLLGTSPVQPVAQVQLVAAESRFKLLGVVAPRAGQPGADQGLALISVDGKPPRAIRLGRELEPGLRLLAVSQRQVDLGAGGNAPKLTLTLPMLAEATRGRPGDLPGQPSAVIGQLPGMQLPQPAGVMAAQAAQQRALALAQGQRGVVGGGFTGPVPRPQAGEPGNDPANDGGVNPALR